MFAHAKRDRGHDEATRGGRVRETLEIQERQKGSVVGREARQREVHENAPLFGQERIEGVPIRRFPEGRGDS